MVILVILMGLILFYYIFIVSCVLHPQAIIVDQKYNLQSSEYGSIDFNMEIIDK